MISSRLFLNTTSKAHSSRRDDYPKLSLVLSQPCWQGKARRSTVIFHARQRMVNLRTERLVPQGRAVPDTKVMCSAASFLHVGLDDLRPNNGGELARVTADRPARLACSGAGAWRADCSSTESESWHFWKTAGLGDWRSIAASCGLTALTLSVPCVDGAQICSDARGQWKDAGNSRRLLRVDEMRCLINYQ